MAVERLAKVEEELAATKQREEGLEGELVGAKEEIERLRDRIQQLEKQIEDSHQEANQGLAAEQARLNAARASTDQWKDNGASHPRLHGVARRGTS